MPCLLVAIGSNKNVEQVFLYDFSINISQFIYKNNTVKPTSYNEIS
jgi:hypothetical protein